MSELIVFLVICLSVFVSSIASAIAGYSYKNFTQQDTDNEQKSKAMRSTKKLRRVSNPTGRFFNRESVSNFAPPMNNFSNNIIDFSNDAAFQKHQQQIKQEI